MNAAFDGLVDQPGCLLSALLAMNFSWKYLVMQPKSTRVEGADIVMKSSWDQYPLIR